MYLHIPFCKTKCSYCDFNCYAGKNRLIPEYVEVLCREIEAYGALGWHGRTIYLGGGTPSLLSDAQVARIIATVSSSLNTTTDIEVTLEANPGTVDEAHFCGIRNAGVNRLSIGIQSFSDTDLRPLGRGHTVQEAVGAYEAARRAGFDNISIDLIYGLPAQTLGAWRYNVEHALNLAPEHVSLYALTIEEGTPLARQVDKGRVQPTSDDTMADMYELAHELMSEAGYRRYEISNWALPGRESQHNLVYWHNEPYIGAGAGAHGYLGAYRYCNELLPERYVERVAREGLSLAESELIPTRLEMAETLIMGLRLDEGVRLSNFEQRYNVSVEYICADGLKFARDNGLLKADGGRLCLTDRGKLLSNEVFQALLPDEENGCT